MIHCQSRRRTRSSASRSFTSGTIPQRALQANADPLLGYTKIGDVGFVVSEISPYDTDLDWRELTEPNKIGRTMVWKHYIDGHPRVRCFMPGSMT